MRNNGDLLDAFVDMVVASRAQRIIGTYYSSYSFWIYARPGAPRWQAGSVLGARRGVCS